MIIDWLRKNHWLHTWTKWTVHGYTYQQRKCTICGFSRITSQ